MNTACAAATRHRQVTVGEAANQVRRGSPKALADIITPSSAALFAARSWGEGQVPEVRTGPGRSY